MCYYKLDYYDVALEILQTCPDVGGCVMAMSSRFERHESLDANVQNRGANDGRQRSFSLSNDGPMLG